MTAKQDSVEAVASPVAALPPGGWWEPPEGLSVVGVLVPFGSKDIGELAVKHKVAVHAFDGLDGNYLLYSDGSTRPASPAQ